MIGPCPVNIRARLAAATELKRAGRPIEQSSLPDAPIGRYKHAPGDVVRGFTLVRYDPVRGTWEADYPCGNRVKSFQVSGRTKGCRACRDTTA